MIPTKTYTETLIPDFTVSSEKDLPTKSYKMRYEKERVYGYHDNIEAMKQVCFKILNTERYHHKNVYSNNYGVEFVELYGKPISYVIPVVQQKIKEALTWDERILSVSNFSFDKKKGSLIVNFTVTTIFGDFDYTGLEVSV